MAKGMVTTARGQIINMDALIESSRRPLSSNKKNDIKQNTPKKEKPLNMRGYIPSQGKATPPELPEEMKKALAARQENSSKSNNPLYKEQTLADQTGVKIDKPKRLKSKPSNPEQASNEVLSEIMNDLEGQGSEKRTTESNSSVRSKRT